MIFRFADLKFCKYQRGTPWVFLENFQKDIFFSLRGGIGPHLSDDDEEQALHPLAKDDPASGFTRFFAENPSWPLQHGAPRPEKWTYGFGRRSDLTSAKNDEKAGIGPLANR